MLDESVKELIELQINRAKETLSFIPSHIEIGDYNTSISRSYYAAFYALKALELKDGFDSKKHSGTIAYFRKNYVKTNIFDVSLSNAIGRLEESRVLSDYNMTQKFELCDAQEMYRLSCEFVSAIEEYLSQNI